MKLYHVSEEPGIEVFEPRPSPQTFNKITGDVVFAVADEMLHNYLLPRDCPRVCYYAKTDSSQKDINKYIGNTDKKFIINVEERWLERINKTKLYLYEMPAENFELLDKGAGYYVSNESIRPVKIIITNNLPGELMKRNAELRFYPEIKNLAAEVVNSSLQFSIIRLRNAK